MAEAEKVTVAFSGTSVAQLQLLFNIGKAYLSTFFQVQQTLNNGTHELVFLIPGFKIGNTLQHGNTTTPAGKQHRTMAVNRLLNHFPWIDFHVSQWNHILREFYSLHGIPLSSLLTR